jgi:hypothetical protein
MDKGNITTTAGQTWTFEDSRELARQVFRRFGNDLGAATAAWRRMLQNSATESDFLELIQ